MTSSNTKDLKGILDIKKLQAQLEIDEGVRYEVYLDSLGLPTFGIGHLVRKTDPEWDLYVVKGIRPVKVTKERVAQVFEADCLVVLKDCCVYLTTFVAYAEEVKQIVANMMFNMGLTRMTKLFKQFRLDLLDHNYKMAAKEMQYNKGRNPARGESMWYLQTKDRAVRLVTRMNNFADNYLCSTVTSK